MNLEAVKLQAKKELEEEKFRLAVEQYKVKLRKRRPLWDRVFPWKIIILRKEKFDA